METLEEELIGKTVMNKKGFVIGVIKGSMIDKSTGKSTSLLVEPSKEINLRMYKLNEQGDIILPSDSLYSVKDIAILEEPLPKIKKIYNIKK